MCRHPPFSCSEQQQRVRTLPSVAAHWCIHVGPGGESASKPFQAHSDGIVTATASVHSCHLAMLAETAGATLHAPTNQ